MAVATFKARMNEKTDPRSRCEQRASLHSRITAIGSLPSREKYTERYRGNSFLPLCNHKQCEANLTIAITRFIRIGGI